MLNKNIVTFIGCESEYEDAKIVLYGAPFDSTTSFRPGTRFGSAAIRNESFGLETYSPYQDKELTEYCVFDSGDLELPMGSAKKSLEMIEERCRVILKDGKVPFMIGGEHLVTLGSMRAAVEKYPKLHIIHFDAHADLRDEYLDVLDPSVFPGTGTPEAGGVSFKELLDAIIKVCEGCNVIGCDVNELSPHYDQSGVSTAVAGKIVREFLIALAK